MTKFSFLLASAAVVAAERKCGDIDLDSLLEEVDMTDFEDLTELTPEQLKSLEDEFEKIKTELPDIDVDGIGEKVEEVIDGILPNLRGRSLTDDKKTDEEMTKKQKKFAAKCKANLGNVVDIDGHKFSAKDFIELVCTDDSKGILSITGKDRHGHPIHKRIYKMTKIRCMKARFCRKPSMKNQGKMKSGKESPASQTGMMCQDKEANGTCEFQCENPDHVVKSFEPKTMTEDQTKELEDQTKELQKATGLDMGDMAEKMKEMEEEIRKQFGDLSAEEIQEKVLEMMQNLKELTGNGELTDKLKMKLPEGLYHKLQLFCDTTGDDEEGVWKLGGKDGPVVDDSQLEEMECGVDAASSEDPNSSSTLTASVVFLGLAAAYF